MAPPPSTWTWRALSPLLVASVAIGGGLSAQGNGGTVRDARVEIAVDSLGVVVHERVTLVGTQSVKFEWRSDPCSVMDPPRLTVDGTAMTLETSSSGPWRFLHVVTRGADSGVTLDVNYRVHPTGAIWSVPLVVPAVPVRGRPGVERDAIILTVTAPDGRAVFPAFTTRATGQFEARLSAVPSLVRLQPAVGSPCANSPTPEHGELTVRFTLLVVTMLLWVPLYFWWARRREKDA